MSAEQRAVSYGSKEPAVRSAARGASPATTREARVRVAITVGTLGASLALAGLYAYYVMFSVFRPYDDEGFLAISVRDFVRGWPIYDDVFTQYGPFFYLLNGVIFKLASIPVDTDSMRLVVVGIWVACALLGALFTIRMTGSVPLAVAVLALTAAHLRALANEPGHPGGLCMLLVMLLAVTATFFAEQRRAVVCGILGALVGCLLMTKLNVGVFALLAVALTIFAAIPDPRAVLAQLVTSSAILALPAILMRTHIQQGWSWVYYFALFATLAVLPILVLQRTQRFIVRLHVRAAVWAAIACAAAVVVSLTAVAIHGTSFREAVLGPLLQAIKFPMIYQESAPVDGDTVRFAGSIVIVFLALQAARWRWADRQWLELAVGGAKIAYAAYVFYLIYAMTPGALRLSLGPHLIGAYGLFGVALPFVWLVMIPGTAAVPKTQQQFARALLGTLAVLNSLQVYPVAGSQLTFGTVLVILVAAVCLHDGLVALAGLLPGWLRGSRPRIAAAGVMVALLLLMQWHMASLVRQSYRDLVPLDLPGARRLRVDETEAALYRWLAFNLHAQGDTFVGMPALNSLYFWSETEPPTHLNPNSWMLLLDDAQQQHVVESLSRHPNASAVVVAGLTRMWMRGRPIEQQPLATYIGSEFQTVGRFHGYEFRVRKDRRVPELIYCARRVELPAAPGQPVNWSAWMSLPGIKGRTVHRMTVFQPRYGRTLADTQLTDGANLLEVTGTRVGGGDAPAGLGLGDLDLTHPLLLNISQPMDALQADDLLVRLFDERGNVFASLPVVL